MLPEIKMYKIDYEFIVKNYLDKRLWKKVWNLFVYKDNVFTLNLYEIDTENNKIRFKIRLNKLEYNTQIITYDVDNTPLNVLLQQINGAIFRLIEDYERKEIKNLPEYIKIRNSIDEERDVLRSIASDFLDENGVTNDDIREVYIESYINRNEHIYDKLCKYEEDCKYTICTDMFIVFCKASKDETRLKSIYQKNKDKTRLSIIVSEVDSFLDYLETEDYQNEMIDLLEGI